MARCAGRTYRETDAVRGRKRDQVPVFGELAVSTTHHDAEEAAGAEAGE